MPRRFTPEDLARILCTVSPFVMIEALEIRYKTCKTPWEALIEYVDFIMAVIPLLPTTKELRLLFRVADWFLAIVKGGVLLPPPIPDTPLLE